MRYILPTILVVGLVFAAKPTLILKPAYLDHGETSYGQGYGVQAWPGVVLDSAPNQLTLALVHQECCAYNPTIDAIAVVNRNFSVGGVLDVHSAPGDLSFWVDDIAYNQEYGPGRYPTAIAAAAAPYISFPFLVSGAWGGSGAQYCSQGWFSSFWDPPVDIGPGNPFTQTCIGKELASGDMCFILLGTAPFNLMYRTYSPDLSVLLATGTLTPDATYYWGWDYNVAAGIGYVFYFDASLNIFYKTTTDGITWSSEQSYNLVWPNPYSLNNLESDRGMQAVVTDAGNPLLVFANMDGNDASYPYYGKVYVSPGSGQACIKVSSEFGAADTECFYPTITTSGNVVAVVYQTPRNNLNDSLTWHDIFSTRSTNSGATWSTPVNETVLNTVQRISIPQLAKRLDVARNRLYLLYGTTRLVSQDIDLMWGYDNANYPSIKINFMTVELGVEEHKTEIPNKLALNITPNPVRNRAALIYSLPTSGNVSLRLFSTDGRLIRDLENTTKSAGVYTVNVSTNELANGTYFVVLETAGNRTSNSLVIVK